MVTVPILTERVAFRVIFTIGVPRFRSERTILIDPVAAYNVADRETSVSSSAYPLFVFKTHRERLFE